MAVDCRMLRQACCAVAVLPACFNPHYSDVRCSPGGECPPGLTCDFANGVCQPSTSPVSPDAVVGSPGPDAQFCYGTTSPTICLAAAPTAPLVIDMATTLDTGTSPLCVPTVSGGGGYCVIAATTITIDATLRATGPRPLVLIATNSIMVSANGVIDVGSHRVRAPGSPESGAGADPASCGAGTAPTNGGGGAGGSCAGNGGNGGDGNTTANTGGTPGAAVGGVIELRGGCAGQDGEGAAIDRGVGGHGGGAVLLIAVSQIDIAGGIAAGGEGGGGGQRHDAGGGGGGAGGMIVMDAQMKTFTGLLLANGGAGGEGSGSDVVGKDGADATTTTAALGGAGGVPGGGDGGDGSAGTIAGAGAEGATGGAGGGGGGGGAGLIKAPSYTIIGADVSPPVTP